jgi:hypothetical protein
MPRLAKPDTESPSRRIRLSGPSGLADISFFRDIFPNGVVIPLPEENNQIEVDRCSLKRKRDDDFPILIAKATPVTRPNKRSRLSDPETMTIKPPISNGFPAPSSTMDLPYWPAAVVTIFPACCDINPIPQNPRKKVRSIKRCLSPSFCGNVEMTELTPMEVDQLVGLSKNWRKNRRKNKNQIKLKRLNG